VVMGVVADQVAAARQLPGYARVGLGPTTLDKERGRDVEASQLADQSLSRAGFCRPVRVLDIERQRDRPWRSARSPPRDPWVAVVNGRGVVTVYRSTPVMTIPFVKTRWKMRKRTIGMIIVIRVPAWMRPGLTAMRAPLKLARPTGSVIRSGFVDR
jgi:hypothetical protein